MYFHARWKIEHDVRTRPMQDWNYLTAKGKGVFGGVAFFIDNPVKDWWGEGDEKIYVDGETFPSHFGTGTEDYYGYGWCCPQLFTHAYHNQPRCDGPGNYGRTSVNRFDILDRIPFTTSFKFDMELWHWKDCKVNMAVMAYYYGLPGADDTFPPIAPEKLVLRPVPEHRRRPRARRDRRREDADPQVHRHAAGRRTGTTTAAASISGGTAGRSRATNCCWSSTFPRRASTRSSAASSRRSTTASCNWPSTARKRASRSTSSTTA